jgi:flagellar basal body-associated protein FliL
MRIMDPQSQQSPHPTHPPESPEAVPPTSNPNPHLRPYQLPPAEQKARDDRDAADRAERMREMQEEADADNRAKLPKRHRIRNFFLWMLLIVFLTGAIGGGVYWFFLRKQPSAATDKTSTQTAQPTTAPPPTTEAAPTKSYDSTNFNLSFDYPELWVVTDNTAKLTVVSPAVKLKAANGTSQNSQITVTIQNKQVSTPAFKAGNATAVRESQKIAYAKPSQNQRANTYLSFLNYADATATGLDGVYVTGDNGYTKGQAIPQVDIAKSDPLITVTFTACADAKCASPGKAMTLDPGAWDDSALGKPVTALLQSIVVQ